MGVAVGDYLHSGRMSLAISHFDVEYTALYTNEGGMNFTDNSIASTHPPGSAAAAAERQSHTPPEHHQTTGGYDTHRDALSPAQTALSESARRRVSKHQPSRGAGASNPASEPRARQSATSLMMDDWRLLSRTLSAQTLGTLVSGGLNRPKVAVDAAGNVYIADYGDNAIMDWIAATDAVITLVLFGA